MDVKRSVTWASAALSIFTATFMGASTCRAEFGYPVTFNLHGPSTPITINIQESYERCMSEGMPYHVDIETEIVFDIFLKSVDFQQTIPCVTRARHNSDPIITTADVNFDGYQDLQMDRDGGNGVSSYMYWVYHPDARRFIELSRTFSWPKINPDQQTVTELSIGGFGGWVYTRSVWGWRDGEPKLLSEERQRAIDAMSGLFQRTATVYDERGDGKVLCRMTVSDGKEKGINLEQGDSEQCAKYMRVERLKTINRQTDRKTVMAYDGKGKGKLLCQILRHNDKQKSDELEVGDARICAEYMN